MFRETVARNDLPSNIMKGTLRTISKLLEYKKSLIQLLKQCVGGDESAQGFRPGLFLKTLYECQFDTHDTY